jgi:hypothetical protein
LWLGFEKLILCCPHSAHSPFSIAPRALSVAFCASVKTDLPKLYFAIATTAHYCLTVKGQSILDFRFEILDSSIDPTDKYVRQVSSDTGFLFLDG